MTLLIYNFYTIHKIYQQNVQCHLNIQDIEVVLKPGLLLVNLHLCMYNLPRNIFFLIYQFIPKQTLVFSGVKIKVSQK